VAVLACQNQTGESSYDKLSSVVTDALTTKLEQIKDLKITTQNHLLQVAKREGDDTDARLDDLDPMNLDLALELCAQEGIEAAIVPRITKVENLFVTHVQVMDVRSKSRITGTSAQGLGVESILSSQIDQVVLSMTLRLGIGEEEEELVPPRLADITTSSLDAYSYFLMAGEMSVQFRLSDARFYCLKAVKHDTAFALAYSRLGRLSGMLGYTAAAREAFGKARAYSYRATEKEQLFIEADANLWDKDFSTPALEKRAQIMKTVLRKYPGDKSAFFRLAWSLRELGRDDEALEVLERFRKVHPESPAVWNQLGWIHALKKRNLEEALGYFRRNLDIIAMPAATHGAIGAVLFMMGRLDEAQSAMERSYEIDPGYTTGLNIGYLHALREDYRGGYIWVERQIRDAASPGLKALGYLWRGYLDFWCGRLESAGASVETCIALAGSVGDTKLAARAEWLRGWIELERGSYEAARACFDIWRSVLSEADACRSFSLYTNGLLDLRQGRMDSARVMIADLERHVAKGQGRERIVGYSMLGLLLKEQLIRDGSPDVAASYPVSMPRFEDLVPPTIPRPFGPGERGPRLSVAFMGTADVTARAYAAQGEIRKAIQEYENLVAPDTTRKLWIPPLYYYRMAKLYDRAGLREKANASYEKFMSIWHTGPADSERTELREAARRLRNQNVKG
jgi:tetratricopeptide (TPR) repeat protein